MSSRTLLVAGALTGLLVLAGCGGGSDEPASGGSPSPAVSSVDPSSATPSTTEGDQPDPAAATRPEPQTCYPLGFDDALAPTSEVEPVECTTEHTSRTFAVGDLDLVVDGHLLAVDSERAQAQPAEQCPPRLAEFLGGSEDDLRLSVLRAVWFSPTVEQSDEGASWYRCDVIALARQGELLPLTGRLEGLFSRPDAAAAYALCATAEPGTDGFDRVPCSADDASWRAIATVPLADTEDYPGEDQVSGAGDGVCEDAARDAAPDPLNFRFGYEYPTAEQWDAGQRYGVCWTPA
ncbi:septum formation family protein [Nocardioides sp. CFH 31398]|uniref:septum formation family protein n=1 Tax=Nocardioides sp. CFH 31398 TaxID=2919579 RepID=UPI001F052788|nr:septum formation family protein [Nocardioides sp. CFH 31398]MCH1868450.1 septum formation family protein [Nocardioides sp. CFH 31398]